MPEAAHDTGGEMSPAGPILSGEDIICVARDAWHGPWKTPQQIMSILGRSNRLLYVGPPVSLRQAVDNRRNRVNQFPTLEHVTESHFVYHEPWLLGKVRPGRLWGGPFNWGTARLRRMHVRRLARQQGMRSPILWVFDPMMAEWLGTFREKLIVYHVLDNYVEWLVPEAHSLRAAIARNEAAMLARADVVFAVSESLRRRCATMNPNSFLVPNGVDYDRFQATIATRALPPDMRLIPKPIIGHVGAIQSDLDFSLLERMSTECRDWSLVFIGPEELASERQRFQSLITRSNVYYLGCKSVEDVPAYINACDVCIMPNIADNSTVPDCDSIKVYEYLACGRPIISMSFPSAERFRPYVRTAGDHSEFIEQVRESLCEDIAWVERRKAAAREHRWQLRAEVISDVLRPRLESLWQLRTSEPSLSIQEAHYHEEQ